VPTSSIPDFPDWLRPAVQHAASELWTELPTEKDPAKSEAVLSRLISDRRMKGVWDVPYKYRYIDRKPTKELRYPSCLTNASVAARNRLIAAELRKKPLKDASEVKFLEAEADMLERLGDPPAPRWSEQDRAVQLLLRHAYREYLDVRPVFLSDLKVKSDCYHKVARVFRQEADTFQSLGAEFEAEEFAALAHEYDKKAGNMLPREGDDPWIIPRQTKNVELRSFVIDLSITTKRLFGRELRGTLATVANVVFDRQDVTGSKVREMLRSSARERGR
jgi:hypothetical protein